MTTARNRAMDTLRRERAFASKAGLLAVADNAATWADTAVLPDERLALLFTCCHPALAVEAQVALTLRTLGGLTPRRLLVPSSCLSRRWPSGWCGPSKKSRQPASLSG